MSSSERAWAPSAAQRPVRPAGPRHEPRSRFWRVRSGWSILSVEGNRGRNGRGLIQGLHAVLECSVALFWWCLDFCFATGDFSSHLHRVRSEASDQIWWFSVWVFCFNLHFLYFYNFSEGFYFEKWQDQLFNLSGDFLSVRPDVTRLADHSWFSNFKKRKSHKFEFKFWNKLEFKL